VVDSLLDELRRLDRLGAIAVEDRQPVEAGEVGSDILARCLIFRGNRDPVAVVLNVKQ